MGGNKLICQIEYETFKTDSVIPFMLYLPCFSFFPTASSLLPSCVNDILLVSDKKLVFILLLSEAAPLLENSCRSSLLLFECGQTTFQPKYIFSLFPTNGILFQFSFSTNTTNEVSAPLHSKKFLFCAAPLFTHELYFCYTLMIIHFAPAMFINLIFSSFLQCSENVWDLLQSWFLRLPVWRPG